MFSVHRNPPKINSPRRNYAVLNVREFQAPPPQSKSVILCACACENGIQGFWNGFLMKGLRPSRNGTCEKLRTSYFVEELIFARPEVPTVLLLKIRIF